MDVTTRIAEIHTGDRNVQGEACQGRRPKARISIPQASDNEIHLNF